MSQQIKESWATVTESQRLYWRNSPPGLSISRIIGPVSPKGEAFWVSNTYSSNIPYEVEPRFFDSQSKKGDFDVILLRTGLLASGSWAGNNGPFLAVVFAGAFIVKRCDASSRTFSETAPIRFFFSP